MTLTTTSTLAPSTIPFSVQGYITDPKLVGYQILTNYESTYWAPLVGNDAWRLYEVLRSFCHNGNSICYPSIQFLTAILGLKEKRVLTGWTKTIKNKEYQYPGLIEILQQHKLVIAEVQGAGAQIHYVFHVNLTPGLLAEEQLARLHPILRRKHAELIERCQQEQAALEAKKKPSKFTNGNKNSSDDELEGGGNLPRGAVIYHGGGGNLPPEQHQYNNTQLTPEIARAINNNSSETSTKSNVVVALSTQKIVDREQADSPFPTASGLLDPTPLDPPSPSAADSKAEATAVLLGMGLAETVTRRLISRYSVERIQEKIEFLIYLQEQAPDRVKNPRGWLRRAIEDNYGAPDGFLSHTEREQLAQETTQRAQLAAAEAQVAEELARTRQAELEDQQRVFRQTLQAQYGTTEEDYAFWEAAKREMNYLARSDIFELIEDAHLLQRTNGTILIGIVNNHHLRRLSHPNIQIAIKRMLERIAGSTLELTFVSVA